MPELTRRAAALLAAAVFALAGSVGSSALAAEPAKEVRVVFVGAAESSEEVGARLGIAEANLQGRYFGLRYALERVDAVGPEDALVISALAPAGTAELVAPGRLVVNVVATDDALRAGCSPGLLHTVPGDAARAAALARWRAEDPDGAAPTVETWHASLVRFAARDLNARFLAEYDQPMSSGAWAGWAAGRALGEAVLRGGSAEPGAVERALREQVAFDGQKGVALRFRRDGELPQPLYLVREGRVIGEVPVLEEAEGACRPVEGGLP